MKIIRAIIVLSTVLFAVLGQAGDSAPFVLDTTDEPLIKDSLAYNSSWIGDDSLATVVIADNGTEVYRGSGVGDYKWTPATSGKHTLTYTTYIDGIAQDEVYEVTVYANWKYEVEDGKAVLVDALEALLDSDKVVIPSEIDGYVVGFVIPFAPFDGILDVTMPNLSLQRFIPGLKQAKFDSNNDFTSSILDSPTCVNVSGVLMGNAYDTESVTRTYSDPLYGGSYKWNSRNTTFGYYGYMYMVAGRKYVFGKYFDDSVLVKIDGIEVLKNTVHTDFATGTYSPETTGWHEIEVRLADGAGEKGPTGVQNNYYWSGELGIAWRDDGITDALPESGWKKLMDPGDGSLFRFYDDSYSVSGMNQLFPSSYASITNVTLTGDVLMLPVDRFVGCDSLETVRLADSSLVLHLDGENSWHINDDGVLQSAKIENNEESAAVITVEGPGKLSFRWKVSSEYYGDEIFDYAYLTIDGVETDLMIGGHTDWEEVEVDVRGDGLHTIKWIYAKDEMDEINLGEDCAWVDSIKFRPNRTVSFDIGLASGDAPKVSSDISETVINLPGYVGFDRPKYTLTGWSDGKDVYAPNGDYSIPVTNITLVAIYEANTIAEPTITSEEVENGGVIDSASAMFSITADAGTTIYYTLDGSTPTAASRHYTRRFSVELLGDVTIKAIAIRDNYFDSPVATFTFKRLPYSAAECLNIDFCEALNGGDSSWFRVLGDEAHDGVAALRSGAIEDGGLTWVSATVVGEGTISFWWKTSSELVRKTKDYASFHVDDVEQAWLAGITDWSNVVCNITGTGTHTLKWVYQKNNNGDIQGEDCAWFDEVLWLPIGELPELGENASQSIIAGVLKDFVDTKLSANITTASEYTNYRAWVLGLQEATIEDVKASPNAWLSYALGCNALIQGEVNDSRVKVDAFEPNLLDGVLSMKVRLDGASMGESVSLVNLLRTFVVEGTASLIDDFSVEKVAIEYGSIEDGTVNIAVMPREVDNAFFVRTRLRNAGRGNGCEVTFNLNGGGNMPEGMSAKRFVEFAATYGELPEPTREGYKFLGWYTSQEGGEKVTADTVMSILASQMLYARWEEVLTETQDRQSVQLWAGGPYWATTNIGAEKPEDYGYYFWWGDTVGYKRENDKWVASDGSNSDFSFGSGNAPTSFKSNSTLQEEGWITSNGVLAPEHDAANVHWGNGWRLPTKEELDALGSNCDWIWTVKNGVNGYVVRGKGGYSSNSIFLPCAGTGDYSSASDLGSSGGCWSSVPNPSYVNGAASWFISFNLSGPSTNSYRNRWSAQSIRPVREVSSSNILSMSGLKAAYFFDGNVNDSSSSGWNLASNGGTYTANRDGEANRAYSFNGQSERLTISHTAISQTFSVAFWFKTSVTLATAGAAGSGSQTGWNGNYALFPMNGFSNLGYGIKVGTDGVVVMAHGDMYLNSHLSYISNIGSGWNHVAVTLGTDGSLSLYLNGNLVQTGTHSSSRVPQFSICPGGDVYGYYTGAMDDFFIFNRALSADEVFLLYIKN